MGKILKLAIDIQIGHKIDIHTIPVGTYPIVINSVRNNLSPGPHVLAFSVRDDLGYTAETTVNYELSEDRVPSNSEK